MAKVYKVTFYYVDIEGEYDIETVSDVVDRNSDGIFTIASTEESEEFEWTDDIDLNYVDATAEQHEAYITKARR